MTATDSLIIPEGCRAVIWGSVNGRSRLFFDVRTEDAAKFLGLYVACTQAEIDARDEWAAFTEYDGLDQFSVADVGIYAVLGATTDDDCWEWG